MGYVTLEELGNEGSIRVEAGSTKHLAAIGAVASVSYDGSVAALSVVRGIVCHNAQVFLDKGTQYMTEERLIGAGRTVALQEGDTISMPSGGGLEWRVKLPRPEAVEARIHDASKPRDPTQVLYYAEDLP
ncbi:hypothetical protein HYV82_00465 [Candidatus Woesearchaeota archaeon]|nr:hypothetical protein [Candidatus Woesearchaeota archaeon]